MQSANYSLVIPIFNESEIIPELWRQLSQVLQQLEGTSEVIFINDGSRDNSLELLQNIRETNIHENIANNQTNTDIKIQVKIINFSRNFGHQCALTAGIDHASGQAVIMMDGDLQDSPAAIFDFIKMWRAGYQVVYAIREKRKERFFKRLAFKTFYQIQTFLSGVEMPRDAGIFSLMDRQVVKILQAMPEHNRYITGLRAYTGFKQTGVFVERGPRYKGEPKVSLVRLFKLAFDGIFSFSTIPLKIATFLGLISAITAFILGLVGLYVKFVMGQTFLAWTYGLTSTFFMGGVQLLSLGIIGEYIGRIYDEVRKRPYYIIAEKIGFDE